MHDRNELPDVVHDVGVCPFPKFKEIPASIRLAVTGQHVIARLTQPDRGRRRLLLRWELTRDAQERS